jgi:hypothetical protein
MHRFSLIRFATTASFALSASLPSQSPQAKPPAAPSQATSTLPATQPATSEPPAIPLTPSQLPPKRAQVTYSSGNLSISADNASLNQILRQIASDTGIKIIGGVADERVFGQYGPSDPAQILAALLDGTGSNMVIVHRDSNSPAELILTPRQGGPTPPNPNAAAFDERSESPEVPDRAEQPARFVPSSVPSSPGVPPTTAGTPNGANPANLSQPDSPNGVKTPQQIYEQLQRMRQQQQPAQPQQ